MADLQLRIVTPLKWHFATKCTLYSVCTHPPCVFLNICERESKGNASLEFLDARTKTMPTEPFLHRTHDRGS